MGHIVHVDNSEFFRKLMKTFLSELGHDAESFSRGKDAVAVVKAGKADCVITGMQLEDMSGEEFVKRLVDSPHAVPVVVVTSSTDEAKYKRLNALGVKVIIQKSGDWKGELSRQLANMGSL